MEFSITPAKKRLQRQVKNLTLYLYQVLPTLSLSLSLSASTNPHPSTYSHTGKTLNDNLSMLGIVSETKGIAAIELNIACPNVIGHPIIGYDFNQFQDVLESLARHPSIGKKPLGLKLPPYLDFQHFKKVAEMVCKRTPFTNI
jgi:dihydroorotate dehydrogenase (fumarate)